jgi:hypothetical protein
MIDERIDARVFLVLVDNDGRLNVEMRNGVRK